jgi:hypothetical protein
VSGPRVQVIPHGVPTVSFQRDDTHKARLGLVGRQVICTFGLINRGKGLEYMIQAMPRIVAACPQAIYLVVGATHPQVKGQEGEVYRESLVDMAESLGIGAHVRFVNKYLDLGNLLAHLQACDVYITPYPGKDQISSGALAYALAAGGAVVSTPYLYAEEVLADGRGLLVPFGDSDAMADATLRFLTDSTFQMQTRRQAYQYTKPMFWPNVGRQYLELFTRVASANVASPERMSRRGFAAPIGKGNISVREQAIALTAQDEVPLGPQANVEVFQNAEVLAAGPGVNQVHRVSCRIAQTLRTAPLQQEIHFHLSEYRCEWQYDVIVSDRINALFLPNGKIAVFTGLLQAVRNDDQLAAVIAHEIAHALAHHASERITRSQSTGNPLLSLAYDRAQESEADHIGLFLMTFAGYDPDQAVLFWKEMQAVAERGAPRPEILSDHPGDVRRIRQLEDWVPMAKAAKWAYDERRRVSPCEGHKPQAL